MQHMWIYAYVKFSKREFQQWGMVLSAWCQLWDHIVAFVLKQALDWRSGARYTGQVCAAEQKVLSIKRSVEFYHCSSKILIIYFIILIVKFYFNSKFA